MGLISAVIFGLIAGFAAKFLMPGRDPGGVIGTMLIGLIGAAIGKWLNTLFGGSGTVMTWTVQGFAMSVLGAIVFLALYRALRGRNS